MKLFRCQLQEGRPATAPALKRDPQVASVKIVEDEYRKEIYNMNTLPHEHSDKDIHRIYIRAIPEPQAELDADLDPQAELGDPAPGI